MIIVLLAFAMLGSIICVVSGIYTTNVLIIGIGIGGILQCFILEAFVNMCKDVKEIKKIAEDGIYNVCALLEKKK
jgi:uncharacterized membrane protein YgaE (UPF0421/DUF939 family)